MISIHQSREHIVVSDRVFRPDPIEGLSAEWEDPMGINAASDTLREHHHAFRVFIESTPNAPHRIRDIIQRGTYRTALYHGLGSSESIEDAELDLRWFTHASSFTGTDGYIAFFEDESLNDLDDVEHQLWSQMLGMCAKDTNAHHWYPDLRSSAHEDDQTLTINGRAFDMVFLHPHADDPSLRFSTPALILTPRRAPELSRTRDRARDAHNLSDHRMNEPTRASRDASLYA